MGGIMIAVIGIGLALVTFAVGLLLAGLTGALGNEFHATAPHIARWLIKRCAVWHPEAQRQDFQDESFDLIDSYTEDGRKLKALLIGLTEFRRSTWSLGVPSWLLSERSDRLGSGLVLGLVFGLVGGLLGGLVPEMVGGLVGGLGGGLVLGLVCGLPMEADTELSDGLVLGLVGGLVFGLVGGLVPEMVGGLVPEMVGGLVLGMVCGLTGFLQGLTLWFAPLLGRRLMVKIRRLVPQR